MTQSLPPRARRRAVALCIASLALVAPASWSWAGVAAPVGVNADVHQPPAERASRPIDFRTSRPSHDVRFIAEWVRRSNDHAGRPFAILDKRGARVFVFDGDSRLIDSSRVLLGLAIGDDTVPGIGDRPIAQVRPSERTTPAGRFVSEPGKNASGEDVVWIDYDAAVSMHRVRPTNPKERRLQRLASADPKQRRISYGCVNLPVSFFETVVWPVIGPAHGIVYVLPERRALHEVFAIATGDGQGSAGAPPSASAPDRAGRASPAVPLDAGRATAATL